MPWGEQVRWVRDENLHITIRFLGEVAEERVDELSERVRGFVSGCPQFSCRLSTIRPFPSQARTRVIAAGVAPEPPLSELNELVERGVVDAGLEADPRRFRAHVTLGRVRRPPLRDVSIESLLPPVPIEVDRVVLYRSTRSPQGSRYTALIEIPLASVS